MGSLSAAGQVKTMQSGAKPHWQCRILLALEIVKKHHYWLIKEIWVIVSQDLFLGLKMCYG